MKKCRIASPEACGSFCPGISQQGPDKPRPGCVRQSMGCAPLPASFSLLALRLCHLLILSRPVCQHQSVSKAAFWLARAAICLSSWCLINTQPNQRGWAGSVSGSAAPLLRQMFPASCCCRFAASMRKPWGRSGSPLPTSPPPSKQEPKDAEPRKRPIHPSAWALHLEAIDQDTVCGEYSASLSCDLAF